MKTTLGDQDYFTMLGWEDPDMFHVLDCRDNMQRSMQYLAGYVRDGDMDMARKFVEYNYCALEVKARIIHFNGCGPLLENCQSQK